MGIKSHLVTWILLSCTWIDVTVAATLVENFATDPVADGRFFSATAATETSFTYNAATKDLTAVLDVDNSSAIFVSTPALSTPVTDTTNAFFRADFRIDGFDNQNSPVIFIGLNAGQHLNDFGDGLSLTIDVSSGSPVGRARIDEGALNVSGTGEFPLELSTDYQVTGRYNAIARRLTVSVFSSIDLPNLVGTSFADLPVGRTLSVSRIGLQNAGRRVTDTTVGSVTLTVDNFGLVAGLIGDADGDCAVGTADYALWAAQFGQSGTGLSADFDASGDVGASDYALWAANFGNTCEPGEASVPEPTSLVLAASAIAAALASWLPRRRRGRFTSA